MSDEVKDCSKCTHLIEHGILFFYRCYKQPIAKTYLHLKDYPKIPDSCPLHNK